MIRKKLDYIWKAVLILVLVLSIQNKGWAQEDSKCFQKIRKYYDEMAKVRFPEEKEVYFFHFNNNTEIFNGQSITRNNVDVKVYMGKDQMHHITNDIEIYQDREDAFMIVKSRKMIVRTESSLKVDKEARLNEILNFQDSLFRHMEMRNCEEVEGKNDKKFLVADMILDSLTNSYHGMRNIRFTYDIDEKAVKRVKFDYLPGLKYKSLTQTIIEMDFNCKRKLNTPLKELFFSSNGRLKPEYAGYRYVNRK